MLENEPFGLDQFRETLEQIAKLGAVANAPSEEVDKLDTTHALNRPLGLGRVTVHAVLEPPAIIEVQTHVRTTARGTTRNRTITTIRPDANNDQQIDVRQEKWVQRRTQGGKPTQRWTSGKEPKRLSGERRDEAVNRICLGIAVLASHEAEINDQETESL